MTSAAPLTLSPKPCPGWPAPERCAVSGAASTGAALLRGLGMAPPPPGRLAGAVVGGTGSGPAGWSAALALGLSTQVARREVVAVPGQVTSAVPALSTTSAVRPARNVATNGSARPRSRC